MESAISQTALQVWGAYAIAMFIVLIAGGGLWKFLGRMIEAQAVERKAMIEAQALERTTMIAAQAIERKAWLEANERQLNVVNALVSKLIVHRIR